MKNLFTTKESIRDLFTKRLQEYLDCEFEDYCIEAAYDRPVIEDFGSNLEYELEKWSDENGVEYVSCEGEGYDGGKSAAYGGIHSD